MGALPHSMAKPRRARRKRAFNLRRVRVSATVATGALAAADVIVAAVTAAVTDPLRIMSVNLTYNWAAIAALADDGLEFGLSHSDYSAAEVEECLEQSGSIDLGSKIAQEQANRLVRSIGLISGSVTTINGGLMFNDGRQLKTKLNWRMSSGDTLNLWIRNGSGVIWTTGGAVVCQGDMWVKDV